MVTVGFRNSPSVIRFAIVARRGDDFQVLNTAAENRVPFPRQLSSFPKKVAWVKGEVDRILDHYGPFNAAMVKSNEFSRHGESAASREAAAIDAMVILAAVQHGLPVEARIYKQLGTKRDRVQEDAEARAGRTTKYWDAAMADAVVAACSAFSLL